MKFLYIDNFDSFANTIVAYFKNTGNEVIVYNSKTSIEKIKELKFDAIILGPGPNGPKDAGNYLGIIDLFHKEKPIFGICLGFQAIMEYFGEEVKPLDEAIHGSHSLIEVDGKTIFKNFPEKVEFARYHSLGVKNVPKSFEISASYNGIIMGARHKEYPIEGVQFHPESILSIKNDVGEKLIQNVVEVLK